MGAAEGKQSDTEALCQTPAPQPPSRCLQPPSVSPQPPPRCGIQAVDPQPGIPVTLGGWKRATRGGGV